MNKTTVKISNIDWDNIIDGEPVDTSDLPDSAQITTETYANDNNELIIDQAIDKLTDKYGFCINNCTAEINKH